MTPCGQCSNRWILTAAPCIRTSCAMGRVLGCTASLPYRLRKNRDRGHSPIPVLLFCFTSPVRSFCISPMAAAADTIYIIKDRQSRCEASLHRNLPALLFHQDPRRPLGMAGLAPQLADQQFRRHTPHIIRSMGQRRDPGRGEIAVLAVIKTHHCQILRHTDPIMHKMPHQVAGDFVIVADNCCGTSKLLIYESAQLRKTSWFT